MQDLGTDHFKQPENTPHYPETENGNQDIRGSIKRKDIGETGEHQIPNGREIRKESFHLFTSNPFEHSADHIQGRKQQNCKKRDAEGIDNRLISGRDFADQIN